MTTKKWSIISKWMFMKVHIEEILLNLPVWLNSENLANTALATEGTDWVFSLALHFASLGAYNVEIYDHESLKYLLLLHLHKSPKYIICLFQIRMYGESKARTEQTFRIAYMNCKAFWT